MSTLIGHFTCGICGSDRARVTLSKARLPVITCQRCHSQTFARGDLSDDLVRAKLRPVEAPAPERPREPAEAAAPSPSTPIPPAPERPRDWRLF